MRYEGNALKYSAFAIVSIESVWPNPQGNELLPNESDMSLLGAEASSKYKSTVRDGFRTPDNSGVETERDYSGKQGYYKILPLNVVNLDTSSTVNGSGFSVSFTLDDLMLVLPKGDELAFRYATGLPISNNDLIESDFEDALPQLISPDGSSEANWKYIKDEELGLSRYRITGPYSAFNVEDLVDVNDTVTIWIYHEPSDFYVKDGLPVFDNEGILQSTNESINGIVGSADRQSQLSTASSDYDETFLFNLGLSSSIIAEAVELATEAEAESQITPVTGDNISDIIVVMSQEAGSGVLGENALTKVKDYVAEAFPDVGESVQDTIVNLLAVMRRIDQTGVQAGSLQLDDESGGTIARKQELERILTFVDKDSYGTLYLNAGSSSDEASDMITSLGFTDVDSFILSLNVLKNTVNEKAVNYAKNYLSRRGSTSTVQRFSNGRRVLSNESHGETPYLALKGVISSVQTTVGTVEGSYIVTISGEGYEKVLTRNEIFYEDLLYPEASYAPLTDYNTVYMNMSPPRAIQQIISRWAARQVVFGKPTTYSVLAFNRNFHIRRAFGVEEDDENEESVIKYSGGFPGTEGETYPIRGTFVYSDYPGAGEQSPSLLRVFAPLNYLDTTRIREMTTVLDKSYRDPSVEGAINTAQSLNGRESIFNNLRRVGGVANFYEMFVDETGKFRYRLKFEALERTPNPGYTPIIQDYDLLSSGNSFSIDDSELVTVVDVSPILNAQVTAYTGLAFIGRSVPPAGKLPLDNVDPVPEESLSPELHRYGMRTLKIQDLYQSEKGGARRKAHLYRGFYGQPIKKSAVKLRSNTSFRPGETVLLSLQKNKKRTRTLIDLIKMRDWMNYLLENQKELEMYIGVDTRILNEGKESYFYTKDSSFTPIPQANMYNEFASKPHEFVATAFRDTFNFLIDTLGNVNVITPEYFPTTYWYYRTGTGTFQNWDEGNLRDLQISLLYRAMLRSSAIGDRGSIEQVNQIMSAKQNQGIINAIKFQNFRATSYYIEGVSHKFTYGADATTSLNLNFGQDNLVLLEPRNFLPIGFISLERKMKIGYDDDIQQELWEEPFSEKSAMQKMYLYQFEEDAKFKKASFLHSAQYFKNSSNYMYEIAHLYEPIDTTSTPAASLGPPDSTIVPSQPYITPTNLSTIRPEEGIARYRDGGNLVSVNVKENIVTVEYADGNTEVISPISEERLAEYDDQAGYFEYKSDLLASIASSAGVGESGGRGVEDIATVISLAHIYEQNREASGGNPSQSGLKSFLQGQVASRDANSNLVLRETEEGKSLVSATTFNIINGARNE